MSRVLGGVLAGGLITGLTVFGAVPADAASSQITICNSSLSFTRIKPNAWGYLQPGACSPWLYNGNNNVRVDTDPDGPSHSYIINPVGAPVGPCHNDSDNHSSDPPNYETVYYRNFDHGNCTN